MTLLGSLDNFYLTKGEQEQSPSRRDGITAAAERELRHYCADVVAEAAVLLRLPQVVAATAQVLVQRFYCKRSLKKFDPKVVAMAAFWLAAKLEEVIEIDNPNRLTLRDVIRVVDRVTRRREGKSLTSMDPYSQRYDMLKQEAVQTERHMLRAFGFVVHVEHPHRFILNYCQMVLFDTAKHPESKEQQQRVQQEAWNMANDSLRTPLCVTYRAEAVACGIIFTAARKLKIPLPENPPWWHLFEVEDEQVYGVCATLCELYSRPRPQPGAGAPPQPVAAASSQGVPAGGTPQVATPLGSPPSQPVSEQPAAAGAALAAAATASAAAATAPRTSDGGAPSVTHSGAGEKQQQQQQAANGTASNKHAGRSRSRSRSRSHSRSSRSRSRSRGRSERSRGKRARSRDRSRSRSRSRSPRRRSRSRDRRRPDRDRRPSSPSRRPGSPGRRPSPSKRERREDRPIYRPGSGAAGRPPRRDDDRRREDRGDYRDRGRR